MDAVIPSNDPTRGFEPSPGYPSELQERDYEGSEVEQQKVIRAAGLTAFRPELLISDNQDALTGPPIIDRVGRVLGGNGRTMILKKHASKHGTGRYQAALQKELGCSTCYGLSGGPIEDVMLVRELVGEYDSARISSLLNTTLTTSLSREVQAVSLSQQISGLTLDWLADALAAQDSGASFSKAVRALGPRLVKQLQRDGIITAANQYEWLASDKGSTRLELNRSGRQKLREAVLGALVQDVDAMRNSPDSLINWYEYIAPAALVIDRWDPENETGYNFIPALRVAAPDLARSAQLKTADFRARYATEDLFESYADPNIDAVYQGSPLVALVLCWVRRSYKSPAKTAHSISRYWRSIPQEAKSRGQGMMMPRTEEELAEAGLTPDALRQSDLGMDSIAKVESFGGNRWFLIGKKRPERGAPVEEDEDEEVEYEDVDLDESRDSLKEGIAEWRTDQDPAALEKIRIAASELAQEDELDEHLRRWIRSIGVNDIDEFIAGRDRPEYDEEEYVEEVDEDELRIDLDDDDDEDLEEDEDEEEEEAEDDVELELAIYRASEIWDESLPRKVSQKSKKALARDYELTMDQVEDIFAYVDPALSEGDRAHVAKVRSLPHVMDEEDEDDEGIYQYTAAFDADQATWTTRTFSGERTKRPKGKARSIHLMGARDDAGDGGPLSVFRSGKDEWRRAILDYLSGHPGVTFNQVLLGTAKDVDEKGPWRDRVADAVIWELVNEGLVEHTLVAPIRWRLTDDGYEFEAGGLESVGPDDEGSSADGIVVDDDELDGDEWEDDDQDEFGDSDLEEDEEEEEEDAEEEDEEETVVVSDEYKECWVDPYLEDMKVCTRMRDLTIGDYALWIGMDTPGRVRKLVIDESGVEWVWLDTGEEPLELPLEEVEKFDPEKTDCWADPWLRNFKVCSRLDGFTIGSEVVTSIGESGTIQKLFTDDDGINRAWLDVDGVVVRTVTEELEPIQKPVIPIEPEPPRARPGTKVRRGVQTTVLSEEELLERFDEVDAPDIDLEEFRDGLQVGDEFDTLIVDKMHRAIRHTDTRSKSGAVKSRVQREDGWRKDWVERAAIFPVGTSVLVAQSLSTPKDRRRSGSSIRDIPGIGRKIEDQLEEMGIYTQEELAVWFSGEDIKMGRRWYDRPTYLSKKIKGASKATTKKWYGFLESSGLIGPAVDE
jgi:predicted flap endonuclease-1-like 5' DNA nuclease